MFAVCRWLAWATLLSLAGGCAHTQLRWNTVEQSATLTDIYEQQVLDNLAMFVHDSGSLPFFAYPNGGGSDVIDEGTIGTDLKWNTTRFTEALFKVSGRRNMKEAWTLIPITDPRRLELMRCAYQQAVANAGIGEGERLSCPDCEKLQKRFYLGTPASTTSVAAHTNATGNVTTACLGGSWFCWGCKKCVPKDCKCLKVGEYCGTYVWLRSGGQEELSKLTLVILDFAINQPKTPPTAPPQATKDVTWYFDAKGEPTTKELAHREVRATVPYDQPTGFDPKIHNDAAEANVFEHELLPAPQEEPMPFAPQNQAPWLLFENYRQFLTPREGQR
jgi:hypothetical protein